MKQVSPNPVLKMDDFVNFVESHDRKRRDSVFHGAGKPLRYLIRPLEELDIQDALDLYNDYAESLSDTDGSDYSDEDESDQVQGSMLSNCVETLPLPHLNPPLMELDKLNDLNLNNECAESSSDQVQGGSDYLPNHESDEDYVVVEAESNEEAWEFV